MSPAEDAALLLRIVRRHLQAMRLNLNPLYPDEEWGFQAQQALEKLLKAQLVLRDQPAPRTHELLDLALLLNEQLPEELLQLQVFAVEARYEDGPFALPTSRDELLAELERRLKGLEMAMASESSSSGQ
ncbi:HEPN domain-containing protein [Vulcanococcus sp. Clear-D1]|jgi:HEPN domain-containing protein|uniref:HEPN domain-containing protein n=1 Tax=Vulcanococcus sp. Clear-D1 TaxID=2766970 RepID=UPI00198FB4C0|nr:HEPN domain-containing protein [Vulcanococcus sp. Clear-D1]MBD1195498.1 HEPN domain-containing protein [Vulcanococcus sp. Clear-D1]